MASVQTPSFHLHAYVQEICRSLESKSKNEWNREMLQKCNSKDNVESFPRLCLTLRWRNWGLKDNYRLKCVLRRCWSRAKNMSFDSNIMWWEHLTLMTASGHQVLQWRVNSKVTRLREKECISLFPCESGKRPRQPDFPTAKGWELGCSTP